MNYTNGVTADTRALPAPLRTAPDMTARWDDVELDFDTAAERIVRAHADDGEHRDLPIADMKTWAVAPYRGQLALVPLTRHHEPRPLRSSAFANLMARVGAPADFLKRLPAPLQLATINHLLMESRENPSATLRIRGNEVAAVVSGRYAPLDPVELVETVRVALNRFDILRDVRVRGLASGLVDNLRLVLPAERIAVKPGDVSAVGIDITASSFARSAIHVSPVVWRLVCSNGLKSAERKGGLSFRHVGESQRLRDGVAEAVPSAVAHARGLLDQWRRAVDVMIEDVARQVDELRVLTVQERRSFEAKLVEEGEGAELPKRLSVYGVVNALTASAKAVGPARRLELEAVAGDVLHSHVGGGP
ncbi:MAG: DUF932 domain-containing protein [Polyangiaceae bacterium]